MIIGVPGRDELPAIQAFIDNLGVGGFDHVPDTDGSIWAEYGINSQPAFAFLGADGSVETHIGPLGVDGLNQRIDGLTSG